MNFPCAHAGSTLCFYHEWVTKYLCVHCVRWKIPFFLKFQATLQCFFNRLTSVVNLSFTTFDPVFINLFLCKNRQAFKRLTPWNIFRSFYRRLFCVVRYVWLLSTRASLSCFRACGCDECGKGLFGGWYYIWSIRHNAGMTYTSIMQCLILISLQHNSRFFFPENCANCTQISSATCSRMYEVDKSGNALGTWYLGFVPSAFWYSQRPGYLFIPGFQLTRNVFNRCWPMGDGRKCHY